MKGKVSVTTQVVINGCFGGFSLSDVGCERLMRNMLLSERERWHASFQGDDAEVGQIVQYLVERDNPALVRTVQELASQADGRSASLGVVEVPDGVSWYIEEYDGSEWVAETHRTWR